MSLLISTEQEALVEAARSWLADTTDLGPARMPQAGARVSEEALRAAGDMGLVGLLRPAEGGTHTDAGLVAEEVGRAGSPLPLAEAAAACRALDDAALAPEVADAAAHGRLLLVPVLPGTSGDVRAVPAGSGALALHGRAPFTLSAGAASVLLVAARDEQDRGVLAVVGADGPEVRRTRRVTLDLTREVTTVEFGGALVAPERWTLAGPAGERLADALAAFHTADAVGAAARLLDMTVSHVLQRRQFGRAVGSFQAVKHHCADMAVAVEAARVAARAALRALDGADAGDRRAAVSAAAAFGGPACSRAAGLALQLHGGMGFTWEHDLHLFLRRIKADELLDGTPRHHRERLLDAALPAAG